MTIRGVINVLKKNLSAKEPFKTIAFMVVSIKQVNRKRDYLANGRFFPLIRKGNAIMRLELITHSY